MEEKWGTSYLSLSSVSASGLSVSSETHLAVRYSKSSLIEGSLEISRPSQNPFLFRSPTFALHAFNYLLFNNEIVLIRFIPRVANEKDE